MNPVKFTISSTTKTNVMFSTTPLILACWNIEPKHSRSKSKKTQNSRPADWISTYSEMTGGIWSHSFNFYKYFFFHLRWMSEVSFEQVWPPFFVKTWSTPKLHVNQSISEMRSNNGRQSPRENPESIFYQIKWVPSWIWHHLNCESCGYLIFP